MHSPVEVVSLSDLQTAAMMRLRGVLVAIGIVTLLVMLTVGFFGQARNTRASTLSETEAAALAITYAQIPMPAGWLVSAPTQVNAQLMPLGAAAQLKDGRPLDPATRLGRESNKFVWLVFLRGDMTVPSADVPGKSPLPPATYHQMAVVLDATTGELLLTSIYPPTHEVSAAGTLPTVVIPVGGVTLPMLVKPTEAPLPTRAIPGRSEQPEGVPAILPAATSTPVR